MLTVNKNVSLTKNNSIVSFDLGKLPEGEYQLLLVVDDKPKKFVIDWLSKNTEYHSFKECVFYVWHVRREYATRCIDVFLK